MLFGCKVLGVALFINNNIWLGIYSARSLAPKHGYRASYLDERAQQRLLIELAGRFGIHNLQDLLNLYVVGYLSFEVQASFEISSASIVTRPSADENERAKLSCVLKVHLANKAVDKGCDP